MAETLFLESNNRVGDIKKIDQRRHFSFSCVIWKLKFSFYIYRNLGGGRSANQPY